MMVKFLNSAPELVKKIELLFDDLRNQNFSDSELLTVSEAKFPSEGLYPSENLTPRADSIAVSNTLKKHVIKKLTELGFEKPNEIFRSYFAEYGLWASINKEKLNGIETYLKVFSLFEKTNHFTKEDYIYIKSIATEIYYNKGKHGLQSITNANINQEKLIEMIKGFDCIFTTNYDTVLDDILENDTKIPYHLHGGFCINHKNKDPDGRYLPTEARLIWGINAEEKYEALSAGWDFGDIDFNAIRFDQSRLADYYDILQTSQIDEFHILGYSGENDDHINSRIVENEFIKKVIFYVNPSKLNDKETQVRSRLLFSRQKKFVELKPWSEFWNKVTK